MKIWPRLIQAELNKMWREDSNDLPFLKEVDEHDHVVGVLDDELFKLFLLYWRYYKKWLEVKAEKIPTQFEALPSLWSREERVRFREANALKDQFWISCYWIFPELRFKPWLVIREGLTVVWRDYGSVDREDVDSIAYTFGYSEPEK